MPNSSSEKRLSKLGLMSEEENNRLLREENKRLIDLLEKKEMELKAVKEHFQDLFDNILKSREAVTPRPFLSPLIGTPGTPWGDSGDGGNNWDGTGYVPNHFINNEVGGLSVSSVSSSSNGIHVDNIFTDNTIFRLDQHFDDVDIGDDIRDTETLTGT